MTRETFMANLQTLGLSQRKFARLLGVDPATVCRWGKKDLPVPKYAVAYIELALVAKSIGDHLTPSQ